MGKTFAVALVPVPGGAMLGGTPMTVRGRLYVIDYRPRFLRQASRLLEGPNNIGGGL